LALAVLADLTEGSCAVRVAVGWGVDALVGRQTRLHRDLDLASDARNETVALRALERRGYRVETDWRLVVCRDCVVRRRRYQLRHTRRRPAIRRRLRKRVDETI
jgi:lincosamide nucleotidyltransferase A/C/D/E